MARREARAPRIVQGHLAIHVLPVSRLALSHPFDGRLEAPGTGGLGLGLGDPFDIFSLVTG